MTIFKIIAFIVVGFIGFCIYVYWYSLKELMEKATKEEKKAIDKVEGFIIFAPLVILVLILSL